MRSGPSNTPSYWLVKIPVAQTRVMDIPCFAFLYVLEIMIKPIVTWPSQSRSPAHAFGRWIPDKRYRECGMNVVRSSLSGYGRRQPNPTYDTHASPLPTLPASFFRKASGVKRTRFDREMSSSDCHPEPARRICAQVQPLELDPPNLRNSSRLSKNPPYSPFIKGGMIPGSPPYASLLMSSNASRLTSLTLPWQA